MRYTTLLLATTFLLAGCAGVPTKQPVCSGNTLRDCQPVVYFDEGQTVLKSESKKNLDWAYEKMVRFPKKYVKVIGHADFAGEADKNLVLSKARANAVKNYLVKKGINKDRIFITFEGESDPLCYQDSCREVDRRAELHMFTPNGGWDPVDWESLKPANWKRLFSEEE